MKTQFSEQQKSFIFDHLNNDAQCFVLIHGWDEFVDAVDNPNTLPAMITPSASKRMKKIFNKASVL